MMSVRVLAFTCVLLSSSAGMTCGQVVQLPTFNTFSVQTSVLAPDRGGTVLGGVRRSSSRRAANSVPGAGRLPGVGRAFGNRALDDASGASGASVHATIIDPQELDRAVLADAARGRTTASPVDRRAADAARRMNSRAADPGPTGQPLLILSVAELRRQRAAQLAARTDEAERLLAQGQRAETRGQVATARNYYRRAQQDATGALQHQITARLAALE